MNSNGDNEYHLYEDELWNDSDIRTIERLFSDNGVLLWYGYSIKDLTP